MLDDERIVGLGGVMQRVKLSSVLFEQGWHFLCDCH